MFRSPAEYNNMQEVKIDEHFFNAVGKLKMNPSRPPAIKSDIQVRRGGFHRTAVGESFIISAVPMGPHAVFPPCEIIDLVARIGDDKVILSWTAPGNDFDKGRGMFVACQPAS